MNQNAEQLQKEIETLDLGPSQQEKICMWAVSKDLLRGEFSHIERAEEQKCERAPCVTLKARDKFKVQVKPHYACDSVASRAFDGVIVGELVSAYIDNGNGRGYHFGKFEWVGSTSRLVGRMSGVIKVGTHRSPSVPCEPCDRQGHMEGRLDAVVVEGDHKGCRVLATYVIDFDPHLGGTGTEFLGTLEGVSICPCEDK